MDYDSDSSVGWINASSDSESSNSVTSNMELSNHEQDNEDNLVNHSKGKKDKKAKKRKHDNDSSVSDARPAKRKHIKVEPESDRDTSGPKDSVAHSESFDNLRIKQESADDTDEPRKKKNKKHKKSQEESINPSTLLNDTQDNDALNISSVEDSVRKKKKKKKSKHGESEDVGNETINNLHEDFENNDNKQSILNENSKRNKVPSSTFIENDLNITNETMNISAIPSTVPKKTKKICDQLKFEDDEPVTTLENGYESDMDVSFSKEVKTFLQRNSNFFPLTSFLPFKTDDEDILILKCPTEIDINNFKDVNLVLDGKSKLKVSGQTYDGIIAETDTKLPLVTYSKKNVYLKNISILKTIVFHKRIPVPHIQDDSVITNNQTRFIPLPDTKSRHPLFGTDYKKAIKVPKVVRERLSENDLQPEAVEQEMYKKKKKHKKDKETIERESEADGSINLKEEDESSKKKKKKRKIKETEGKPAKRIKQEQDPGAWESEKAIEKNLFNF